jgi:type II secretory pathway component GspD/PulD (secretin)
VATPDGGKAVVATSGEAAAPAKPAAAGEKPPEGKPGPKPDKEKEKEGEKKPDGKEKEKPEEPAITKRPAKPAEPPKPEELKLRPGPDGKIRFDFRGQTWPDVLQWLAEVSGLSLDWQELPGDYLNLITQRSYTVEEARDLINLHLLARGFTSLLKDDVLTVVKIDKLNPALVPRVEPADLTRRQPHEFVKVSFSLDWLMAESAVDELKPMLSPNGKLTALKTTNRLEAMDAVINLRELYAVLQSEQSDNSQERLIREFVLKFARAEEVREQLLGLLGESKKSASPLPLSPEQMQMMQQQAHMMAEMQRQQQQQRGGQPPPADSRTKSEVHLVVNQRRNSILAQATPDRMAIIAKAVETIDVPVDQEQRLLANINRMQVYRLVALDPEAVVKTLTDTGDLDPTTRLQVDKRNKTIIAYGSLADHLTIRTLVQKLDGSSRKFEVIRLRKLAADYVAGSIAFMMGQEEKQEERSRYYGYWSPWSERRSSDEGERDKFRVEADTEGNRLLLWANEIEMSEVKNLLVKLGELPAPGANPDHVRVLDLPPAERERLLERIRQAWPSLAPNKLVLPPPENAAPRKRPESGPEPASPPRDNRAQTLPRESVRIRFAQLHLSEASAESAPSPTAPAAEDLKPQEQPAAASAGKPQESPAPARPVSPGSDPPPASPAEPPPVHVTIDPDGRAVIASQDTAALDLLEELLSQATGPRKEFQLFQLRYASAYWVRLNLESYFKEGEKEEKGTRRYYFYDHAPPEKKKEAYRLSRRKQIKFIDDFDTNTILVMGADAEQLRTIEELVRLWDTPPPKNSESARVTSVFAIRYSKASVVAETVKEVYRDLLSSNDKALQQGRDDKRASNQTTYIFGEGGSENERRTQVNFKGKLSIGVDEVSNTLLVSTEGQNLMENVSKMIEALDKAALPANEVRVVTLQGGTNAQHVREVLARILGQTSGSGEPPAAAPNHPHAGQQPAGQQPAQSGSGSSGNRSSGNR